MRDKLTIAVDYAPKQIALLTKIADEGGRLSQHAAGQIALTLTRLLAAVPAEKETQNG